MPSPDNELTSRRVFLRNSAAALIAGGPALELLNRSAVLPMRSSPLKSAAQYRAEAAQFETAFREFSSVTSSSALTTDLSRTITRLDPSALAIDFQNSWMVSIAMEDPGLVAWVKAEIRDKATFDRFVTNVKRDPRSIYSHASIAALSARLEQLKSQKRAIATKIIEQERKAAGLETSGADQAAKAAEAQECAKTWAIITAIFTVIIAVVVAVLIAVVTAGVTSESVETAAIALVMLYTGTGAEFVSRAFTAANQRYAQCVAAAKTLPLAQQAKALAKCQAALFGEKLVYIG